jgi:hypothetical protein
VTLTEKDDKYGFIVEAPGYLPDTSQTVNFREGNLKLQFALIRRDMPSGIVRLPSGDPVSGAFVYLCGGYTAFSPMVSSNPEKQASAPTIGGIKEIRPGPGGRIKNAITDESGRFSVETVPDAHTVIAAHKDGFAAVSMAQLAATGILALEPWGRLEGSVRIGNKPGIDQRVALRLLDSLHHPPVYGVSLFSRTDEEGKFVFSMVPPGEYHVAVAPYSFMEGQSAVTLVKAGATSLVHLGGTGRPVIGRIVIIGSDYRVDWRRASAKISLKLPEVQAPKPQDGASYVAWLQSEDRVNQLRSLRNYPFVVTEDGSFRVDDIPAGTYVLTIAALIIDTSLPEPTGKRQVITKEFVIPEMAGGRTDAAFDLGVLTLQSVGKQ